MSEHEEKEKVVQDSNEQTHDAVNSGDETSDEWTMMDIGSPSSKCQPGVYVFTNIILWFPDFYTEYRGILLSQFKC